MDSYFSKGLWSAGMSFVKKINLTTLYTNYFSCLGLYINSCEVIIHSLLCASNKDSGKYCAIVKYSWRGNEVKKKIDCQNYHRYV